MGILLHAKGFALSRIQKISNDWLPPLVKRFLKRTLIRRTSQYRDGISGWDDANLIATGYDAANILDIVLESTLKVRSGQSAFERDSVTFDRVQYSWQVSVGLMWAAASNRVELNVLDFGGALGSSYFQNKIFIDTLPSVRWNVIEQTHYVSAGKKFIEDGRVYFYPSIEDCLNETTPNIILLSSVLQYLPHPEVVMSELNKLNASIMVIDRTPFIDGEIGLVVVQEVPKSIYSASYPMHIFPMDRFEREITHNWNIIASDLSPEGWQITNLNRKFYFRGMLLERNQ
jgi:putative methyltransferase (TIGR04325 family)